MFNTVDLYQFAGDLYKNAVREVELRTVINRAYYSAFLSVRDIAKITNSSGSVHQEVLNYTDKRTDLDIFNQLKQLRKLRIDADYKLNVEISKRDAAKSLKLAQYILKTLNYLP